METKPRKVNITDFKKINDKYSETSLYENLYKFGQILATEKEILVCIIMKSK